MALPSGLLYLHGITEKVKVSLCDEKCEVARMAPAEDAKKGEGKTEVVLKSQGLLPKEYEQLKDFIVPVGISNKDLGIEGLEPKKVVQKLSIDGAQGEGKLNLYVFRPARVKAGVKTPVIYFIHGGGYQFGNTNMDETKIQGVADGSNATVVSVDYTLANDPSYKYPMELEDAYAGLLYVYEHADELNVDKNNMLIEGESAGGGLTARLALYNRDKGRVPLKGQILIYPMLDYRRGSADDIYDNEFAGELVWRKENNVSGWGDLIAGQKEKLDDGEMIYFSPAVATVEQLKGLPQTFMIVGSIDLFCDEDMDYAQKLMQAGVFTELHVEPGVPHAYEYLEGTPQASRFYELRDSATARILGTTYDPAASLGDQYGGILKYLLGLIGL